MRPTAPTRLALAATVLTVTCFAGCGTDSETKIVHDAPPASPPLAPASKSGLDSTKTDPGAGSAPAPGNP